jgi:hypothetical protein
MMKTLVSTLALAFVALAANVFAPNVAHADACSDLAAIVQNPQGGTGGEAAAASIRANAERLQQSLCVNGAAADASAPSHTPAQLAAVDAQSSCGPYTAPPMPPAGATPAQMRAGVGAFNTWAAASNASMSCHGAEIHAAQRDTVVYDAAALVWQQHYIAQVGELQAAFNQFQAPAAPEGQQQQQQQQSNHRNRGSLGRDN